jgi:hypothetical protein
MKDKQFEDRVRKKQFWPAQVETGDEDEWWCSSGADAFIDIGYRMMAKGLEADEVLSILGECHSAVAEEYGD